MKENNEGEKTSYFYQPFRWKWDKVKKGIGSWVRNLKVGATVESGKRVYRVMRSGALLLLNPTESRRARHKKAVREKHTKRFGIQLFRRDIRIYDSLEAFLKGQERQRRRDKSRKKTTHPKQRRAKRRALAAD